MASDRRRTQRLYRITRRGKPKGHFDRSIDFSSISLVLDTEELASEYRCGAHAATAGKEVEYQPTVPEPGHILCCGTDF